MDPRREQFAALIARALAAVDGRSAVRNALRGRHWPVSVHVAAVGKAAVAMAQGAAEALGKALAQGLVITRRDYLPDESQRLARTEYLFAGHPLPDQNSLQAGAALARFVAETPQDAHLLMLISGGASALVERLPPGVTLDDWRNVNQWLLGSGLDIRCINAVRKSLSSIKAGRLATLRRGGSTEVLLISDVPGDNPQIIGSGLMLADESAAGLTHALMLPPDIKAMLQLAPPFPATNDSCFQNNSTRIVANNAQARAAVAQAARELGVAATIYPGEFTGTVAQTAHTISEVLGSGAKGIHIWGGEPTLTLPAMPGRGGRNLHLALSLAQRIAGRRDAWFLSLATDGSDGNTPYAGALVDGLSIKRGEQDGRNAANCLAQADSAAFLEAAGDVITTGPTGTNVMDLMIGWINP